MDGIGDAPQKADRSIPSDSALTRWTRRLAESELGHHVKVLRVESCELDARGLDNTTAVQADCIAILVERYLVR